MPAIVVSTDAIALGPGFLWLAAAGTAAPTNTVAGSVFTDAVAAPYVALGATEDGSEFSFAIDMGEVEVEEFQEPIKYVAQGRKSGVKFALAQVTATNLRRVLNGGTIAVTGTAATTLSTYTPPVLGAEIRQTLLWESQDSTERIYAPQVINVAEVTMQRKKGTDKATLSAEFRFEQPTSGSPFTYFTAGTVRG